MSTNAYVRTCKFFKEKKRLSPEILNSQNYQHMTHVAYCTATGNIQNVENTGKAFIPVYYFHFLGLPPTSCRAFSKTWVFAAPMDMRVLATAVDIA